MTNDTAERTTTVFQIVYASAATVPFSDDDLVELLTKARTNNEALGVTGMLLYHEGSFIQALEGEQAVVEALYERIGRDERHDHTLLLFKGAAEDRAFDEWTMGFHRLDPTRADHPDGLNRFMQNGVLGVSAEDGERIRQILIGFKSGKWHR